MKMKLFLLINFEILNSNVLRFFKRYYLWLIVGLSYTLMINKRRK